MRSTDDQSLSSELDLSHLSHG